MGFVPGRWDPRDNVRKILGAVAATNEFKKKIFQRHGGNSQRNLPTATDNAAKAKVDAFTNEAYRND